MFKDKEKEKEHGPSDEDNQAATRQILPGKETVIEIAKGDGSLGLSIVGGRDTTLNAIVIHEVYDTGAAWNDKRLWAGDQILEVDNRSLSNVTHEEAKNILLQTGPRVRLRVWRDDKEITEADIYELLELDLVRRPGSGFGFSIVGRSKDEGVLISDLIRGGVAEGDRRLQPGDRILEINGKSVRMAPHAQVATMLKSSQGKVNFLVGRLRHVGMVKSKKRPAVIDFEVSLKCDDKGSVGLVLASHPSHVPSSSDNQQGIFVGKIEQSGAAIRSGNIRPDDELICVNDQSVEGLTVEQATALISQSPSQSVLLRLRRWNEPAGRLTVRISRTSGQGMLGFSIVGGRGTAQGDYPIYVRTITDDSAAKNLLFKGDRIDFVNGRPFSGVTHEEAVAILKGIVGDMTLVIHRPGTATAAGAAAASAE